MQIYLGSLYVNDFNKFGRTYSVRVQRREIPSASRRRRTAEGPFDTGEMGRWSALLKIKESAGPEARHALQRFLTADLNGRRGARLLNRQAQAVRGADRGGDLSKGIALRMDRSDLSGNHRRKLVRWCFSGGVLLGSWCSQHSTRA